jgi:hypothetical protein
MIAALFVEKHGVYSHAFGESHGVAIDQWHIERDARRYNGPYPVIAHPPCQRWGRYWGGCPSAKVKKKLGDDGGCFESALRSVRKWGGVLEHPEGSHAWRAFTLNSPPRHGGWIMADWLEGFQGWTCCVEQGFYGHRARKATWLYTCKTDCPPLKWGRAPGDFVRMEDGLHSAEERRRAIKTGMCQRLSKKQRIATPIEFRDLLISIARTVKQ